MKVNGNLDMQNNSVRGASFNPSSSAPTTYYESQWWYDSTNKKLKGRTDSAWKEFSVEDEA